MANTATGQSSTTMVDQSLLGAPPKLPSPDTNMTSNALDYSKILKPETSNSNPTCPKRDFPTIAAKLVTILHGESYIKWFESEVAKMNVKNLQHAIVGKFYGWLDLEELRTIIPAQCKIIGDCQIEYYRRRHILIRLSLKEFFINITLKAATSSPKMVHPIK